MAKKDRIRNRLARKSAETAPTPAKQEVLVLEELAKKLADEGYRVWSQSPQGKEALKETTDTPQPLADWETKHQAPTAAFKDVDGTVKRLNVITTINHYVTNEPRTASLFVGLEQLDPKHQIFRPLVRAAYSNTAPAELSVGEYGAILHPEMSDIEAAGVMAQGIDRAEIELHRRRPSVTSLAGVVNATA